MSKNPVKSYQFGVEKGSDGQKLTLSGDLSLNNIKAIKEELTAYASKGKAIKLAIRDAENMDLGFIQLIKSFILTAHQNKIQVDVDINITPEQQQLLDRSGIKLKF